ncbi:MAG: hypothetical protein ABEJ83_00330 [Candidatus Nanohaloarchaea archaeon]
MEGKFLPILAVGLTIFGLIFIANSTDTDGLFTGGSDTMSMTLYETSLGKVGQTNSDFRTIDLGSFTAGETRGMIEAYSKDRAEVTSGLFGGKTVKFRYNGTQPFEGNLTFEVLGRKGDGKVWVKVNGKKVFEKALISTATPTVTIPRQNLNPGMNTIRIGASSGLLSSVTYALEDIQAVINDRKFHNYEDSFVIYSYELQDYVKSPLSFTVTKAIKTKPLKISINGNKVFSDKLVRVQNKKVEVNPSNADLHPGANKIEFSTEGSAVYHIQDAELTMHYMANIDRKNFSTVFELNQTQLDYVKKDSTAEKLVFDYQNLLPSPRPVYIKFNSFNKTFIPENAVNRISLDEKHFKEENSLNIQSNGTYKISQISIKSQKEN